MTSPTMKIFYGPPGSGKTFRVVREAVRILVGNLPTTGGGTTLIDAPNVDQDKVGVRYRELVDAGRVWFVTFHPSYSYEDFIEGFRPKAATQQGAVAYDVAPGPFQRACEQCGVALPWYEQIRPDQQLGPDMTVTHVDRGGVAVRKRNPKYNPGNAGSTGITEYTVNYAPVWMVDRLDAAGYAPGSYTAGGQEHEDRNQVQRDTEIPSTVLTNSAHLTAFHRRLQQIRQEQVAEQSVVLIIDEINRADLSRVMGELVTLLEPVKRLGQPEELKVWLPYSKRWFGVPSQLSVIGTMNTTDRSLAVVDFALRRRFEFVEIPPDPTLCPPSYGGINVQTFLSRINERIEYLRSREQCVGHAELMKHKLDEVKETFAAPSEQEREAKALAWVIRNKLLPLLLEYFPEEWRLVHIVLGNSGLLERREPPDHLTKLLGNGEVASVDNVLRFKVDPRWDPHGAWNAKWFRDELCANDTALQVDLPPPTTAGAVPAGTK